MQTPGINYPTEELLAQHKIIDHPSNQLHLLIEPDPSPGDRTLRMSREQTSPGPAGRPYFGRAIAEWGLNAAWPANCPLPALLQSRQSRSQQCCWLLPNTWRQGARKEPSYSIFRVPRKVVYWRRMKAPIPNDVRRDLWRSG